MTMLFGVAYQAFCSHVGLLLLRVSFGALILAGHGAGKLEDLLQGQGRTGPFGMEGVLPQFLITFAEFFCAILIIVGLASRFAAIPLVIGMLVAVLWGHADDPLFPGRTPVLTATGETIQVATRAKELALLYASAFAALLFTGPGKFSLDALVGPWLRRVVDKPSGARVKGVP